MEDFFELVHLPSNLILEWPGEGPLFQLELKKCRGQYVGTIRVIPRAIIYVKSGTLGQVSHQCKSLSYVVSLSNLLKITYLLASKNVECSLSKHLCLYWGRYSAVCNRKIQLFVTEKKYIYLLLMSLRFYLSSHS